jgi:hypothetical protein
MLRSRRVAVDGLALSPAPLPQAGEGSTPGVIETPLVLSLLTREACEKPPVLSLLTREAFEKPPVLSLLTREAFEKPPVLSPLPRAGEGSGERAGASKHDTCLRGTIPAR